MRVAIPEWQGRVSPVLDVAGSLMLVDVEHGDVHDCQKMVLDEESTLVRAKRIAALGVDVLVCGAISTQLEIALNLNGVQVIKQACGDVDRVLQAFLAGRLQDEDFLMPGCCGRQRRFRKGRRKGGCTR